jgi:8-amino-7-oxononanoate synthase
MAFEFLADTLKKRTAASLRRIRQPVISSKDGMIAIEGKHYLNFASNDYLGLSQHEQVLQSYVEGLAVYGSGSGASSVVTGYSAEHKALEEDLCEAVNKPAALLFSSGFAANQAICQALFGDTKLSVKQNLKHKNQHAQASDQSQNIQIIADKYMHASFIQGALETQAQFARFKHNDMQHAKTLIAKAAPNSLIATEGVFSMDGDVGNIAGLQSLLQAATKQADAPNTHKPWLFIDDAHAIGVIGKNGFGSADCVGIDAGKIDIIMGTFGKALGTSGAFVAGSHELIEYMVNMSKHYVYSTAISGAQARATRASLALVEQGVEREKLHQNIAYFSQLAQQKGIALGDSNSAIMPIIIGDPVSTLKCSESLADLGLWVGAIRTPTVAKHTDRLRITLSALHSKRDIDALVDGLAMCVLPIIKAKQSNLAR